MHTTITESLGLRRKLKLDTVFHACRKVTYNLKISFRNSWEKLTVSWFNVSYLSYRLMVKFNAVTLCARYRFVAAENFRRGFVNVSGFINLVFGFVGVYNKRVFGSPIV